MAVLISWKMSLFDTLGIDLYFDFRIFGIDEKFLRLQIEFRQKYLIDINVC